MVRQLTVAIAAFALWPLTIEIASAQEAQNSAATQAPSNDEQSVGLQEIVITAQRHEETAQHAAIAISTLSGDDIKNANVTRPGGLTAQIPSLQVADDTGPYSIFYVRGVGNFAANGLSDAALAFNFDGVTVSRSGTSGFFYDLERVEVLKGPQGTLYGRNATGGAINVLSKQPVLGEFGADASLEYGNYSTVRVDGMVNLPLTQTAATRVAAFHVKHDGYMQDGTDDQDDSGGRLSFRFTPDDSLNISLVADTFKQGGAAERGNRDRRDEYILSGAHFQPKRSSRILLAPGGVVHRDNAECPQRSHDGTLSERQPRGQQILGYRIDR